MATMTITEALAEVKTVQKRLDKKRETVLARPYIQGQFRDPLANDGGTAVVNKQEIQAIGDLEQRLLALRSAIHAANAKTQTTVCGKAMTIADWLNWRRDVLPARKRFVASALKTVHQLRKDAGQKGVTVVTENAVNESQVQSCLDEAYFTKEAELLEEIEGTLDGKLSLLNATTVVDV